MTDREQAEQEQSAPERDTLLSQVEHSLVEAEHGAKYAAASALAEHYAFLIDCAAPTKAYATAIRVLQKFIDEQIMMVRPAPEQREIERAWDTVRTALAEHSVASDLGPKLLTALERLDLTTNSSGKPGRLPAVAATPGQREPLPTPIGGVSNALTLLRGGAAERNSGARG